MTFVVNGSARIFCAGPRIIRPGILDPAQMKKAGALSRSCLDFARDGSCGAVWKLCVGVCHQALAAQQTEPDESAEEQEVGRGFRRGYD